MPRHKRKKKAEEHPDAPPAPPPPPLAPGDRVQLDDEDAPVMTLLAIHRDDASVRWFDTTGRMHTAIFHVAELERAEGHEEAEPVALPPRSDTVPAVTPATQPTHQEERPPPALSRPSAQPPPHEEPAPPGRGHSSTSAPQGITGEGDKVEGVLTDEGKGAARATAKAESSSHGTSKPSTPHGKGK